MNGHFYFLIYLNNYTSESDNIFYIIRPINIISKYIKKKLKSLLVFKLFHIECSILGAGHRTELRRTTFKKTFRTVVKKKIV